MDSVSQDNVSERPYFTMIIIFVSIFILGCGTSLQSTAVSLRANIEGFSKIAIGLISSGYFAGLLSGSFFSFIIIKNAGYVRTFAAFASLASASSLAHILLFNHYAWFLFRFVNGLSVAVVLVVVESWLNASIENNKRGKILSAYSIIYLASQGITQPLIGILPPSGYEIFAVTSILISLCLLPVTLAQVTGSPKISTINLRILFIFKKSPIGSSGVIISGLITGIQISLAPIFAQSLALEESHIGIFLMTFSLGTIIMQWPLGLYSDNRGRRQAILLSTGIGSIAALFISFSQGYGLYLLFFSFLFGCFALPLYSLSIATVNDQLYQEEMVEAASALYIFYGCGSVIGPVAASVIVKIYGMKSMFVFISIIMLLFLSYDIIRIHFVPKFKIRGKSTSFKTVPATSVTVYNLVKKVTPAGRKKRNNKKTDISENESE